MRIVSMSPYARVRRRCRARAIWACLSRMSSCFLGLNFPQKDWDGKLALVDLLWSASSLKDEKGRDKGMAYARWREEHVRRMWVL